MTGRDPRPEIGVGMLGYAFMGTAHSHAWRTLAYMTWPPPMVPRLVAVAGRDRDAVAAAADRFGFASSTTNWRDLVADDSIGIFDNVGPNSLHAEPTIAAAEAGKHVLCEKPLGRDADESHATWVRVARTGVQHMCGFNYRFLPAVRLARQLLEEGELGEVRHFRGRYLQEWGAEVDGSMAWRFDAASAGSGALGDLGSHLVDLARYLVGEVSSVAGATRTFVTEREGSAVDVDDAVEALLAFDGGATGTIEASRMSLGRKNGLALEIDGTQGSIRFDLERPNELLVHMAGTRPGPLAQGFRTVLVTESTHPFLEHWWPPGHVLGWEHSFVHEIHHLLRAIAGDGTVGPHGATFEDGYRAAEVCDAILLSASSQRREVVVYRGLDATPAGETVVSA